MKIKKEILKITRKKWFKNPRSLPKTRRELLRKRSIHGSM
jgi:hypothetical protein